LDKNKEMIIHTTIMKGSPRTGNGYPLVVFFGHTESHGNVKKKKKTAIKNYMAYCGIAVMNAEKSRSRFAKGAFTWWCPPKVL